MTIQKKLTNKLKEKKGFSLLVILAGVIAFALIAFPLAKWLIHMAGVIAKNEENLQNFSDRLEMQSIIQDYWQQMNSATYTEFEEAISAKGLVWEEDIGDKYKLKISFSKDGKYVNDSASCKTNRTAGDGERHCRLVSLSIVSKSNALLNESLKVTRVSLPNESSKLSELESKLSSNESKFSQYYKKTETDSRYIKKGAKS